MQGTLDTGPDVEDGRMAPRSLCANAVAPKVLQVVRPPLGAPPALPLDLVQQPQDGAVLGRVAHAAAGDPERLDAVGPGAVVVVRHGDAADLAGVPERRARPRRGGRPAQRGRPVLQHQEGGRVVELVARDGGRVAVEDGRERLGDGGGDSGVVVVVVVGGIRRGDHGHDGPHLGRPAGVPVLDEPPEPHPPGPVPRVVAREPATVEEEAARVGLGQGRQQVEHLGAEVDGVVGPSVVARAVGEEQPGIGLEAVVVVVVVFVVVVVVIAVADVVDDLPGRPLTDGDEGPDGRDEAAADVHADEAPEEGLLDAADEAVHADGLHEAGAAVEVAPPGLGRAAGHLEHAEHDARGDDGRRARGQPRQQQVDGLLVERQALVRRPAAVLELELPRREGQHGVAEVVVRPGHGRQRVLEVPLVVELVEPGGDLVHPVLPQRALLIRG
ncbi:hypothetical protein CTA1_1113 [Colletotrichum tanaceti]|uniref:Uncharacterized protein n=1 Tax=Colletotrichum tanaceti TaxID=1306861 RepID=A0A4U6X9U3_9PEZI|nr:hypothetical protein CTA1_1113 [Colletotrichum tanaceti]